MSQRECAGFNWPRFAVGAWEPITISPESIVSDLPVMFGVYVPPVLLSDARGDVHEANIT